MTDQAINIGLLWHSVRSGNLGVGALTVSNIALIREACGRLGLRPHLTVLGPREASPVYVREPDVEALDIDGRFMGSPSGYWRTLRALDCVVDIGAGDSFAEIYGPKRFGYLWLTKFLAVTRGLPLLMSPQTIGPFEGEPWRKLAGYIMDRAQVVLARDPLSFQAASELARKTRLREAIDVAFALPFTRRSRAGGPIEIGINVSGLLFNGGYGGGNQYGLEVDYAALMRGYLTALSRRDDVAVKLITHVVSADLPVDDDGRVADLLAREFPKAERVPDFASPSEAKSYISGLDLLVGGRMHACIAAYSSGVPVIPVAYSRKFSGLFEGVLGYRHGVPVKGLSTEEALAYLTRALDRRDALREEIEAGLRTVDAKLDVYRAELDLFLGGVAAGRRKAA
jgi:polysaccharide pyruvyl transferase WcaK-like protein